GAVLGPDATPQLTRALGDDPTDQSTLVTEGVQVSASSAGGAFFDLPHAVAENAVDGDPDTAWLFGDFRRATGETLTLTLPEPQELDTVEIRTTALGDVAIDSYDVRASDVSTSVDVTSDVTATIDLGGALVEHLELTVVGLRGD